MPGPALTRVNVGVLGSGARSWTFSRPRQSGPDLIRPMGAGKAGLPRCSVVPSVCSPPRRPHSPHSPWGPAPPATATPASTPPREGRRWHLRLRRSRRPGHVRPRLRHRRRELPHHPADLRRPADHEGRQRRHRARPGRGLRGLRGRAGVHLRPPRGRDVHRRHGLQRRGGLLQLRPLVQLRGPGRRPRASEYYQNVFGGFASTPDVPEPLRELRGDRRVHRRHQDHPGDQPLPGRPDAAQLRDAEPDGARGVRRQQPQRQRGRAQLPGVRPRAPDRHRPVQARELGRRQRRGHHRPQRGLLGRPGQASRRSSSAPSPTGTPAARSSRPARSTATTSSPRRTTPRSRTPASRSCRATRSTSSTWASTAGTCPAPPPTRR